jgi:chromosome partitioning protein
MCVGEERLEELWPESDDHAQTVLGCVQPILAGLGDIRPPHLEEVRPGLALIPGDLGLSKFEDKLSDAWPRALDRDQAAYRTLSAFHRIAAQGAREHDATLTLIDVGPNLGAINRTALLAADHVITPLAPDLFSMQGLRNLGPTLHDWRLSWRDRLERCPTSEIDLPTGRMNPLGYLVMQTGMRLTRPVKAYQRWVDRIPSQYHSSLLNDANPPDNTDLDPCCLGVMRHYQSLMPLAQDAHKPMFDLKPGDGAIGAHIGSVMRCREDFTGLAERILARLEEDGGPPSPS